MKWKYTLTATNHFTRWTKIISLQKVNEDEVVSVIEKSIINRSSIPYALILDNSPYHSPLKLTIFVINKMTRLRHTLDYYPQGNGNIILNRGKLSKLKAELMKFQHVWLGPFQVEKKIGQGTCRLKTLQGKTEKLPVNGKRFKRYF